MGPDAARAGHEFAKCAVHPAYFTDTYLTIDDAQGQGDGTGVMPFKLWPAQFPVMESLATSRLLVILKARQLGITWVCCAYVLWLVLFHPGKVVILLSKGKEEASENLRRVKMLYRRLPDWLRERLPRVVRGEDSQSEVEWSNGSRVKSLAATETAGRSLTGSCVVFDETAYSRYAAKIFDAAKPTIDGGGQFILLSTANGIGGLFHNIWTKAVAGLNGFRTVFLPWWSRPDRGPDFRDRMAREANDPKTVPQEYPASATEAFLVSGRTRFEADWVIAQSPNVSAGIPRADWPAWALERPAPDWCDDPDGLGLLPLAFVPGLVLYELPKPGARYLVAGDVAEGKEPKPGTDPDYDAAVIVDADDWREVGNLVGRWEPDEYARHLMTLSDAFQGPVVVERNNHGHAVLTAMKLARFPDVARGHDGYPGWLTNVKTKPEGVDLLAECLRDGLITVRSQATLDEMLVYRRLKQGDTGAPAGYHDDRVISWYLWLSWLREQQKKPSQGGPRLAGSRYQLRNYVGR